MATVNFTIKSKKNPASIYVRLRDGKNVDLTINTSKTINPKYWNKGRIRKVAEFHDKLNLENDLNELQTLVLRKRNESITTGEVVNRFWLEKVINEWRGKNQDDVNKNIISAIEFYIQRLPNLIRNGKKGVSKGTIRNYKTTLGRLQQFQSFKKHIYSITEIDLTFHTEYVDFASNQLGLSINSISKDISNIKAVCREADERGIKTNRQTFSRSFKAPKEKALFTTLDIAELRELESFKGKDYLENTRDWLIIGCWTGCRAGDLMKLTLDHVHQLKNGKKYIQYTQSKTGKTVKVPINESVNQILDRLNGFPRPISNQKYNKYLKELCKGAGFTQKIKGSKQNPITHKKEVGEFEKWELIRSHIGRRSFATNHYSKMTNKQIIAVTGHSTEEQLLSYIGEVEPDHLDSFYTFWEDEV